VTGQQLVLCSTPLLSSTPTPSPCRHSSLPSLASPVKDKVNEGVKDWEQPQASVSEALKGQQAHSRFNNPGPLGLSRVSGLSGYVKVTLGEACDLQCAAGIEVRALVSLGGNAVLIPPTDSVLNEQGSTSVDWTASPAEASLDISGQRADHYPTCCGYPRPCQSLALL